MVKDERLAKWPWLIDVASWVYLDVNCYVFKKWGPKMLLALVVVNQAYAERGRSIINGAPPLIATRSLFFLPT